MPGNEGKSQFVDPALTGDIRSDVRDQFPKTKMDLKLPIGER